MPAYEGPYYVPGPGQPSCQQDAPFRPITPFPAPFPGDDTEELTCVDCGSPYTMREYRVFAWVEHSDRCVTCGSAHKQAEIAQAIREAEGRAAGPKRGPLRHRP